jgi:N6-adenosine-specific RNA methylase IME4/ParB-like chromosome segregation protein Spo0J
MSAPLKSGERARAILDEALRSGSYRSSAGAERQACVALNVKRLLTRDKHDADLWFPTDVARKQAAKVAPQPNSGSEPQRIVTRRRIDSIHSGYRLREADQAKVDTLKSSIREMGLRTPISVQGKSGDDRVTLGAGKHRLEAMRQLGEEFIDCFHEDVDDLDRELWEIDENLCRAELTAADKALFTFRRKEIYLMKHPETANGGDRRSDRQVGELKNRDVQRFTAATAAATGQSERAVQRDSSRGERIIDMALHRIRGTRLDNGSFLDRLKQIPEDRQVLYVEAALAEEKQKAADTKENRTAKMQHSRMIRTAVINAIAERGRIATGGMPRAAFAVGYCDVPWQQEAWSDVTGQDKGLMYPALTVDELKALCAGEKSPFTRDAKLFFWTTTNRFHHAIDIIRAWGFEYVSAITWDKVHIGMGREVRDRTEHLLICKRGNFPGIDLYTPKPESLYSEPKTDHSRKPVWFAAEIERLHPAMRKLELFQRRDSLQPGDVRLNGKWEFWGNQAGAPEGEVA